MGIVLQILALMVTLTVAMEAIRRFGIVVGWLKPVTFSANRSAALIEPPVNPAQQQLIDAVDAYFAKKQAASGPWSSGT